MIRNWLENLRIRKKLNVITVFSILSIVLMGVAANFFFRTSQVLTIIINSERIHTLDFQLGIEEFYEYINTGDTTALESCYKHIAKANTIAYIFGESVRFSKTKSSREFSDSLFVPLKESFENDPAKADLMVNRVKLLLWMGNEEILKSIDLAALGAAKGNNIISLIKSFSKSKDQAKMLEIKAAIADIHEYYRLFAKSISEINNFASRLLIAGIILITLILSAITLLFSFYLSNIISRPLLGLVENIKQIVKGNIDVGEVLNTRDELGMLSQSFGEMQKSLQTIVDQTVRVSEGDYSIFLDPKSEQDKLTIALNKMTAALKQTSHQNEVQNWHKTGQNVLNEKMRGDLGLQEISMHVIEFLTPYLSAQVGVVYLLEDDNETLKLYGSYAFVKRKQLNDRFKMGEGIVGQAAFGKQMISVTQLPDDYTRISSATGDTHPRNIVVQPLIYNDILYGVVELASKDLFEDQHLELLASVSENVAIAINSAKSRKRVNDLLVKTQKQAEELIQQQEELRVSNEELEEQTSALKESQKELQLQQEELRVTNEELEEKTHYLEIQKKEMEVKNAELNKIRVALEEKANELETTGKYKSEFLANMSHELRTPLNSLLLLAKNLMQNKKGNLTPDQIESIEIIRKSGNDLLNLINEILDLSKIESGKMTLNFENISFVELSDSLKKNFSHMANEKGLQFNVSIDKTLPESFETDRIRLEQVLKNILSNAIKFTPQGSVSVTFKRPSSDTILYRTKLIPSETIAIEVIDTGIGIPKEKQQIIFEAFQQADGSTSRNYGGTGLGLSITKEIVRLFGGEIHLESQSGTGSTFTIFLPQKQQPALNQATTPPEKTVNYSQPTVKPEKVTESSEINISMIYQSIDDDRLTLNQNDRILLVIEDDIEFAKILRSQCREKGFKFLHSATGENGILMAQKFKPDAIILDIKLPGIDGVTVLGRIKDNPAIRHIPVHIMSAMEQSSDIFQIGAIGFLAKPIDSDQLDQAFMRIETFIERKVKDLLIVEDNEEFRKQIVNIIGKEEVRLESVGTGHQALEKIRGKKYDCIVMDLGLPDITGFELLKKLEKEFGQNLPPIIIYTGKELTHEENHELKKYAESIIIKGVKSEERLLDETSLFLHRVVDRLPKEKQEIISTLHNKEAIFKGKKVLLVDDDMRNVFALSKILSELGMIIYEAENGKVALEKLNVNHDIDIVLMDIMMPVMDGYEAMKMIRKKDMFRSLPIIALTAKAMRDDYDKCISSGASDYLTKPIDVDKLTSLMSVWLYK